MDSRVIDPASRGRSQKDGTQLIEMYRAGGLDIQTADNAVDAGIYACEQLMYGGRIKAFTSLRNLYRELRSYRSDKDSRVVKEGDHLMDARRYLVMSGRDRMRTKPQPDPEDYQFSYSTGQRQHAWMNWTKKTYSPLMR
jgi:hypothetical protein